MAVTSCTACSKTARCLLAISLAPNDSLRKLGSDFAAAVARYGRDATAAGRSFVEIQNAMLFASVLRTWIHDEEEGLAKTMAALDRALGRGQRWSGMLADLCRFSPTRCLRGRRRHRRRDSYEDEEPVAA